MAFTAPRTWVTGEIVTAALMNTHVRDNLIALEDRGDITHTEPAYALDTVYQNTTNHFKLVIVTLNCASGDYEGNALCDAGTPPTDIVAECSGDFTVYGGSQALTFPVPPSWYYKITQTGQGVKKEWHEWEFLSGL